MQFLMINPYTPDIFSTICMYICKYICSRGCIVDAIENWKRFHRYLRALLAQLVCLYIDLSIYQTMLIIPITRPNRHQIIFLDASLRKILVSLCTCQTHFIINFSYKISIKIESLYRELKRVLHLDIATFTSNCLVALMKKL